jgi:hypothetical protein
MVIRESLLKVDLQVSRKKSGAEGVLMQESQKAYVRRKKQGLLGTRSNSESRFMEDVFVELV